MNDDLTESICGSLFLLGETGTCEAATSSIARNGATARKRERRGDPPSSRYHLACNPPDHANSQDDKNTRYNPIIALRSDGVLFLRPFRILGSHKMCRLRATKNNKCVEFCSSAKIPVNLGVSNTHKPIVRSNITNCIEFGRCRHGE